MHTAPVACTERSRTYQQRGIQIQIVETGILVCKWNQMNLKNSYVLVSLVKTHNDGGLSAKCNYVKH